MSRLDDIKQRRGVISAVSVTSADVTWLIGEVERLNGLAFDVALDGAADVVALRAEVERLTAAEARAEADAKGWHEAFNEASKRGNEARGALTRIREACDNLGAPFDRMVVRRAIGGNHIGLAAALDGDGVQE